MDIRHLKYFIAVGEELNIGRAANRLNISQPPLTRQIHQLEEELGVELLTRTPRGVELTQAGEFFLDEARNILALMSLVSERTKLAGKGKLGQLDIGIFGTGILSAIPKLLQVFRDKHPEVQVVLHTMTKDEQIQALRQKRITVGFNRLIADLPDIQSDLIMREPLYLAVNSNHPFAQKNSVHIKDVVNQPLVMFPTGARPNFVDKVIELCSGAGFAPKISQIVGDAVTGVALVSAGFGMSLVPESVISLKPAGVTYLPFADDKKASIDLSCLYRREDNSPLLMEFLAAIQLFKANLQQSRTS